MGCRNDRGVGHGNGNIPVRFDHLTMCNMCKRVGMLCGALTYGGVLVQYCYGVFGATSLRIERCDSAVMRGRRECGVVHVGEQAVKFT